MDETIDIRNPASQKVIASVRIRDKRDIDEAVARARKAQKLWAELSFKKRIAYFKKLRKLILQNQDYQFDHWQQRLKEKKLMHPWCY